MRTSELLKEVKVYTFMRSHVGKEYKQRYLSGLFGYKTSSIWKTRVSKYISLVSPSWRRGGTYRVQNRIWIDNKKRYKLKLRPMSFVCIKGLILVDKDDVPWWLLEEHGGPIKDNELMIRAEKSLSRYGGIGRHA